MASFCTRFTVLLVGALCFQPAYPSTWTVELDGSGDFAEIQPAVDAAATGDTILIGPGRFDTFYPFTAPAWTEPVIVGVTKDSLTFIGSGREVTIVGTETIDNQPEGTPKCFCSIDSLSAVIRNMTIENVDQGVYWWRGDLRIVDCLFRRGGAGYYAIGVWVDRVEVEECDFEFNWLSSGILAYSTTENVIVRGCRFVGPGSGLVTTGTPNVSIESCTFDQLRIGVHMDGGSSGSIENSMFSDIAVSAIKVTGVSTVDLNRITIEGCLRGIDIGIRSNGNGSSVVVDGSTSIGVFLYTESRLELANSHLLPNSGYAVFCDGYNEDTVFQNATNCYWGTADADSIAAMIWDGSDDVEIHSFVNFEPFSDVPLPTEKKTMGGLKAMFRGGQ